MASIMVALSAICFSFNGVWTVLLQDYQIDGLLLTGIRMAFTVVFSGIILLFTKTNMKMSRRQTLDVASFGVIGVVIALVFYTKAIDYMSIGLVCLCNYTYPILVAIASCVLFREKLTKWKVIAAVFMVAGLALTSGGGSVSFLGIFLGLMAAVCFGSYVMALDHSTMQQMPSIKLLFYVSLFGGLAIFLWLAISGGLILPAIPKVYFVQAAGALITQVGGMVLLAEGIKKIGATKAAFLSILEPAGALIWDTLFFHTVMSPLAYLGIGLMFLSFVVILKDQPSVENISSPKEIPVSTS